MLVKPIKLRNLKRNKADGTNAGATAQVAAATDGSRHHALHIIGWTDAASLVTLVDNGGATLLEVKVEANKPFHFPLEGDIVGSADTAMDAIIATSTADCSITLATCLVNKS
jgi:hypothetical protein